MVHKDQLEIIKFGIFMFYSRMYFYIDPTKLNLQSLIARLWGVNLKKFITITLLFNKHYTLSTKPPKISVYQSGDVKKFGNGTEGADKEQFTLFWTIENRVNEQFFNKYWPFHEKFKNVEKETKKNWVYHLMSLIDDTITNCTKYCIICHEELPYQGIKPTICTNKLCVFSYERYGLGFDLDSYIKMYPDVVDLMISMSVAACSSSLIGDKYNCFEPYPKVITSF
jgi:hypothetical protein